MQSRAKANYFSSGILTFKKAKKNVGRGEFHFIDKYQLVYDESVEMPLIVCFAMKVLVECFRKPSDFALISFETLHLRRLLFFN